MSIKRKKEFITNSFKETQKVGETLAQEILKFSSRSGAVVLALQGDLGGGKTTFLQGFARGLGVNERVLSPTFVILRKFSLPKGKRLKYLYHFDCYRIENPKEILNLGFEEIISDPQNIVCVEWADKIKEILPKNSLWLKFNIKNKNQRKIIFRF